MATFQYTARSKSGEKIEGTIDAHNKHEALAGIEHLGQVPIAVRETKGGTAPESDTKKHSFKLKRSGPGRMSTRDVLTFSTELSDLLASGMTLGNALNTLSHREGKNATRHVVADLRDEIVQGSSLSGALSKHPKSFSALYASMIKAGEESGAMPEVLKRLVDHYERMQEVRDKVVTAMVYPAIVLAIGAGTVTYIVLKVLPRFEMVFQDLNATLPMSTQALMAISAWIGDYGVFAVAGIALLVLFAIRAINTEKGRFWWHGVLLKTPLIRGVLSASIYANFARTLASLLTNGVQVLKALAIVEETTTNVVIAKEIRNARDRVTDGTTISGPLAAGKIFPRTMIDMLSVGEQTGNVPGSLGHIARRYEQQLDRNIKIFTTALEPILIVVIAVIVGFVALSILSAVFSMTNGLDTAV